METREQRLAAIESRIDDLEGTPGKTAAARVYESAIAGGATEKDAKDAAKQIVAEAKAAKKK